MPTDTTLSYLVSTAGHAQQQNDQNPHHVESILQLIDEGATELQDEKVVGFTSSRENGSWVCDRYSYPELISLSDALVKDLRDAGVDSPKGDKRIVSMLCPTGLDFLIAWIALMRTGYGVVLIAPQCSPSAIAHLIHSSESVQLVYHPKYTGLARAAGELDTTITHTPLPSLRPLESPSSISDHVGVDDSLAIDQDTISHVFHTSGTSGTPKPIPNTHYRSVAVLPRRAPPTYLVVSSSTPYTSTSLPPAESAAYTTTPLFHGGVSDLLRAWMARSMIYFYPTSDMPITTDHLIASVNACQASPEPLKGIDLTPEQEEERKKRFQVKAFLSVPYILTILAEDGEGRGVEMLRSMDYVSTGGAPLDTIIGAGMVEKGVHLVSRLGSSECGFLLSSHRDYELEKDWEWLRNDSAYADALVFEQIKEEAEKYEMVVTDQWQSKTKSNRDDGSYATGDLYIRHFSKKDVWKYVGRGDDVIVLSNGEKASPGPIESALRSSPLLSDALVVGADRDQLGVLLFPKDTSISESNLLDDLAELLNDANRSSPSFAQVSREMCRIVQASSDGTTPTLPKSSKGTVQRGLAYESFKAVIEALYSGASSTAPQIKRSREEIEEVVRQVVEGVTRGKIKQGSLEGDTDLFAWGVDSLMATRIRAGFQNELQVPGSELPRNIIFENPSISRLVRFLYDLQEGAHQIDGTEQSHQLMRDLVEKYGDFSQPVVQAISANSISSSPHKGKTILLTGATGSLGSFLLAHLAQLPLQTVERIICLVRAEDDHQAELRVKEGLAKRELQVDQGRYVALASDLTQSNLGQKSSSYTSLIQEVDEVVHAAWPVHFTSTLPSFESNIQGTRHLLDIIAQNPNHARLYFCSSLASVLAAPQDTVSEAPSDDPSTASPIGYSQSKWVTERVCRLAADSSFLQDRVKILRVGQLCGDTKTGYWNEKEGWPLMIRTAETTGCLPTIDENPSWLPVDVAARAIADLILASPSDISELVYHVIHPQHIAWTTILQGVKAAEIPFEQVSSDEWLRRVEKTDEEDPSRQMLSMWQAAYGSESVKGTEKQVRSDNALRASPSLREVKVVDETDVGKMISAWRKTGFLRKV